MTTVDFYILPDVDLEAKLRFACRIARVALDSGLTVHVVTDTTELATQLDDLMWEYPTNSFLPHVISDKSVNPIEPITIGPGEPHPERTGCLVNTATTVPETFFSRFARVAEIVIAPERKSGRDRYRFYRERGYVLNHHQLDDWD